MTEKNEELTTLKEVLEYFEELALSYPYLDEYDIMITEDSNKPIIIMSPIEFEKIQKKVLGNG